MQTIQVLPFVALTSLVSSHAAAQSFDSEITIWNTDRTRAAYLSQSPMGQSITQDLGPQLSGDATNLGLGQIFASSAFEPNGAGTATLTVATWLADSSREFLPSGATFSDGQPITRLEWHIGAESLANRDGIPDPLTLGAGFETFDILSTSTGLFNGDSLIVASGNDTLVPGLTDLSESVTISNAAGAGINRIVFSAVVRPVPTPGSIVFLGAASAIAVQRRQRTGQS